MVIYIKMLAGSVSEGSVSEGSVSEGSVSEGSDSEGSSQSQTLTGEKEIIMNTWFKNSIINPVQNTDTHKYDVVFVRHGESQSNYIKNLMGKTHMKVIKSLLEMSLTGFTHPFLTTFGRLQAFSWGYYTLPTIVKHGDYTSVKLFCSVLPRAMETAMCIKYGYKVWLEDNTSGNVVGINGYDITIKDPLTGQPIPSQTKSVPLDSDTIRTIEDISEIPKWGINYGSRTLSKEGYEKFLEYVNVFNSMPDCKISRANPIYAKESEFISRDILSETLRSIIQNKGIPDRIAADATLVMLDSMENYIVTGVAGVAGAAAAAIGTGHAVFGLKKEAIVGWYKDSVIGPGSNSLKSQLIGQKTGFISTHSGYLTALGGAGLHLLQWLGTSSAWPFWVGVAVALLAWVVGQQFGVGNKYQTTLEGIDSFFEHNDKIFDKRPGKTPLNIVVTHGIFMSNIFNSNIHEEHPDRLVTLADEGSGDSGAHLIIRAPSGEKITPDLRKKVLASDNEKMNGCLGWHSHTIDAIADHNKKTDKVFDKTKEELKKKKMDPRIKETWEKHIGDLYRYNTEMGELSNPNLMAVHCRFGTETVAPVNIPDDATSFLTNMVGIEGYGPGEEHERVSLDVSTEVGSIKGGAPRERVQPVAATAVATAVATEVEESRPAFSTYELLKKSIYAQYLPPHSDYITEVEKNQTETEKARRITIKDNIVNHNIDTDQLIGCCHDPLSFWKEHNKRLNMGMIDKTVKNISTTWATAEKGEMTFAEWLVSPDVNTQIAIGQGVAMGAMGTIFGGLVGFGVLTMSPIALIILLAVAFIGAIASVFKMTGLTKLLLLLAKLLLDIYKELSERVPLFGPYIAIVNKFILFLGNKVSGAIGSTIRTIGKLRNPKNILRFSPKRLAAKARRRIPDRVGSEGGGKRTIRRNNRRLSGNRIKRRTINKYKQLNKKTKRRRR